MNKPKLFLLHFAGGSVYSFQFLKSYLPEFEFIPLELPGRGKRVKEKIIKDFELAAEDIYHQIVAHTGVKDFLIYGHSMGAAIALKVANLLEKAEKFPSCIIVSGSPGPGVRDNKKRYLLEKGDFKEELKRIGGMPEEVLSNDELFSYFEPLLKADFEVVEKSDLLPFYAPVETPIYAIMGSEEENVVNIGNWKRFTSAHFVAEVLNGDHFFINNHAERIAEIIKSCYRRYYPVIQ
ncbi:MAG TPA: alpha/beta fold hydrolase [Chitinophaga sp.]|jgi:surfactin synthase thioesterase subunit|uniref:thioesterase II family protein n=1 Tax=Chitinophaga sp. TaxID=1869181 RepID=UPI002DBC2CC0|nr:alpha/beta fold hydrolase [Chitinophaga sp.]HEU4555731.1 alpha/beta fold hydrolase [Chitinophaga sp.]